MLAKHSCILRVGTCVLQDIGVITWIEVLQSEDQMANQLSLDESPVLVTLDAYEIVQ
jgi:hypothetical protein